MERWRARSRVTLIGSALLLVSACGDEAGDPDLTQDASSALTDAALTDPSDAAAGPGNTGGPGGGDAGASSGSLDAGGAQGAGDAGPADGGGRPPRDAGGVSTAEAGPLAPVGDGGPDPYAEVRQVCVDTINMYRATRNLPALMRADAPREACADEGAKYDGDLNRGRPPREVQGHASTANRSATCRTMGFGAQNTCPNWGVGPRTGNATLADALKRCLAQMWAEGEPPIPISECIKDRAQGGCFLTHGHWINMVSESSSWVACGFYNVEGGTYWLNQDFGSTRR